MLPAPATRVTFVFQCQGYGWTITLYLPSISAGFTNELAKAQTLVNLFNAATNQYTGITYVRCQNASTLRQGVVQPIDSAGSNTLGDGVQPQSCAYLRLYNAAFTMSKLIFFRGLPTNAVTSSKNLNPASQFGSKLYSACAQMVNDGWCWAGKNPAQIAPQNIVGITQNVNGQANITFANTPFVNPPVGANTAKFPLVMSGIQGADLLNGKWVVQVSGLTPTVATTVRKVIFNPWTGGGTGYSPLEQLITIGQAPQTQSYATIERFGERKCGRPLYLSRGRSNRKRVTY